MIASMKPYPRAMPNMWGTVRRKPKWTPEARTMALFGPGVTQVMIAKIAKAVSVSIDLGLGGTLPRPGALVG
jgi:hypothetical protein